MASAQARSVVTWPPVQVERVPGEADLPWPRSPGADVRAWRVDLLEIDRPELAAWLAEWEPGPASLARRVPLDAAALAEGRVAIPQPGAYVIRSRGRETSNAGLVVASRLRLALQLYETDLEVLCADSRTGQPVQGAFVRVVYRVERLGAERVRSESGTTDATGRWHTSLVRDRFAPSILATAVAVHDNHCAITTRRRALDHRDANVRLTLRAQSPAYFPGQTAEFTGFIQRREGHRLVPIGNAPVKLTLLDPQRSSVSVVRERSYAAGSFTGAFRLPADTRPGPYRVVARLEEEPLGEPQEFGLFRVRSPPRRPFHLDVSLDRPILEPGDALALSVAARTSEDEPLAGAKVRVLSWGYPVALKPTAGWLRGSETVEDARVAVLPAGFPAEGTLDDEGELTLRWRPGRDELPESDMLCAVQATVEHPERGKAAGRAEFVLLAPAPPLSVQAEQTVVKPSEPIQLSFRSPLPLKAQASTHATCTLSYEDAEGEPHSFPLVEGFVSSLADRTLTVAASTPGRYAFSARVGDRVSEAAVWVADGDGAVSWSGAPGPALLTERPWCKRGEAVQAVVTGTPQGGPVALTLRSSTCVQRQSLSALKGARALRLRCSQEHSDPVEATLVQVAEGAVHVGRATLGVEPGGRSLVVSAELSALRRGEQSERDYKIISHDRLGRRVQTIVRAEWVRPTFDGAPPAAVRRHVLDWQPGQATRAEGQIVFIGVAEKLLARSYGFLIEALAPDGRTGATLRDPQSPRRAPPEVTGAPRSQEDKLAVLVRHGLADGAARWLAGLLLTKRPELAATLPDRIAEAETDEAALERLRLAVRQPGAALEAALARGEAIRPRALAVAGEFAAEARTVVQEILVSDARPEVRRAAAEVLGRALPLSLPSLAQALTTDSDVPVRAAAARALGNGHEAAAAALAEAMPTETSPEVRLAIVGALGRIGGRKAAAALLDALDDGSPDVVRSALRGLHTIGYRGDHPLLFRLLRQGEPPLQAEAAQLLAATGTAAATRAICEAARRRPSVPVLEALATIRSPAVRDAMLQWLDHEDPAIRLVAAEHLAALNDERAFPVLRNFLDPSTPRPLLDRAARAVLERRNAASVPKLVALLETGRLSHQTRLAIVQRAGESGWSQAGVAVARILWRGLAEPQGLRGREGRELWLAAVRAAPRVGPVWDAEIEGSVPEVAADSPYAPALAALRTKGVAGMLRALWWSPLPEKLRRATVTAYARLEKRAAARDLVPLLRSPGLQGSAARALADMKAVETLIVALTDSSAYTRAAAAGALGAVGDIRAVPALDARLEDSDPFVRLEAAHALATITRRPVIYTDHLGEPQQASP
ncbi:MAG: HEAT repeat domain-containing protein [Planctomycetota bacterium]